MAEKISEPEIQDADAEKRRLRYLAVERTRTAREKHQIKEISGWMYVGPGLGVVAAVVVGLIMWIDHAQPNSVSYWFFGIALAPLILLIAAGDIKEKWEAACSAKYELSEQLEPYASNVNGRGQPNYDYKFDCIYTDSLFSFVVYQFAKICSAIYTLAALVAIAILLFLWLGTISIAPTTIIIILLVMILLKQHER